MIYRLAFNCGFRFGLNPQGFSKPRRPKKELLIALKIHAARLTDSRDIVALCHDINFEVVEKFIHIGNAQDVRSNLDKLMAAFKSDNFKDAFKGVFSIEKLPKDNIENAIKLMEKLSNQIKP